MFQSTICRYPCISIAMMRISSASLETSQYIKDLSNRWVTFDGQTVISCADHFCLKKWESEKNSSKSVCTANHSWPVKTALSQSDGGKREHFQFTTVLLKWLVINTRNLVIVIACLLETSPYIKDLSNRWVTFGGPTVICCADTFWRISLTLSPFQTKMVCAANASLAVKSYPLIV